MVLKEIRRTVSDMLRRYERALGYFTDYVALERKEALARFEDEIKRFVELRGQLALQIEEYKKARDIETRSMSHIFGILKGLLDATVGLKEIIAPASPAVWIPPKELKKHVKESFEGIRKAVVLYLRYLETGREGFLNEAEDVLADSQKWIAKLKEAYPLYAEWRAEVMVYVRDAVGHLDSMLKWILTLVRGE